MREVVYNAKYGGFSLSDEAVEYMKAAGYVFDEEGYSFGDRDIERHNPILVAAVKALGERASGSCANLQIEQVSGPYMIEEYDGYERVVQPHHIVWL